MSNQIKGGRKPVAAKVVTPNPYAGFFSRSLTDVPEDVRKEIEEKGLEMRWIDAKDYTAAGNLHTNYWAPYKRAQGAAASHGTMDPFGTSPEGYIQRKGLVLATRPKQLGDAHRAMIKEKTERLYGAVDNDGLEED